jgi:uncharacterized membrane protein YccC
MQASAPSAAEPRPMVLAGFPVASWTFAVRIWLAVMLALYASFWLELHAPSTAAITVAILALPTRGQGLEKAAFRVFGTVLGVLASIAIAGLFSQTSSLILAVFGVWVGLCAYAAGLLDGNRAYAAALCCITVGLIAVQQIDSPQLVFTTGVARGAAIVVGVLSIGLVNDVLATPDYHPVLLNRLEALHDQVTGHVQGVFRGESPSSAAAAGLLRDIAALRPEIASLATESSSGNARSAAARAAMVDLVGELSLARALALLLIVIPASARERITLALQGNADTLPAAPGSNDQANGSSDLLAACLPWLQGKLLQKHGDVRRSLDAMRDGLHPAHAWRAPLYRSHRIAAGAGVRAAVHFASASAFFVITGWPATEICLTLVAVVIGLSSTAPDPRQIVSLAVLATPIACLLAGVLKYLILDGVSEFQLLAIGLAPVVIGLALLITLPNRTFSSLGRLVLVFTLAVLAPTNPQTYDPSTFLISCLFVCLATMLSFAGQLLFPPLSNDRRLRQLLKEARHELDTLDLQRRPHLAPEEAMFLDASRIDQIAAVSGNMPSDGSLIDRVMRCFDQAAALRWCRAELDMLAGGPLAEEVRAARTSLTQRNTDAMLTSAEALREAASPRDEHAASACAALVLASVAFGPAQSAPSIEKGAT